MNKKIWASGLLISLVGILLAPLVSATTFGFYPLKINVKEGQTFRLAVNVNPNGQKNYTVKAKIQFPSDLVSVSSWQFSGQWLALNQPGYDYLSNADGTLIKTAGYTGGFDKALTFGTITFKAKKTGTGVIKFAGDSLALDEANTNQYSGGGQVSLTISQVDKKSETPAVSSSDKAVLPTSPVTTTEETASLIPSELNPPLGEEPANIELATNTPSLISPAEIKRLNSNFDSLNSNLSVLIITFSIVAALLFVMIITIMIGLLTLARSRHKAQEEASYRKPLSDINRVSRNLSIKLPATPYNLERPKLNKNQVSKIKPSATSNKSAKKKK